MRESINRARVDSSNSCPARLSHAVWQSYLLRSEEYIVKAGSRGGLMIPHSDFGTTSSEVGVGFGTLVLPPVHVMSLCALMERRDTVNSTSLSPLPCADP